MTVMGRAAMALALGALFGAENGQIQNQPPAISRERHKGDEAEATKYRAERSERKRAAYAKRNRVAIGDRP